jgi:hypothetical protein
MLIPLELVLELSPHVVWAFLKLLVKSQTVTVSQSFTPSNLPRSDHAA